MDALDELLDGYVARKRAEREECDRQQSADAKARENAQRLVSAIVLPVLREIAESVQAKGHHCKLKEHFGGHTAVTLDFQPFNGDPATPLLFQSTLFVSADGGKSVKFSQSVQVIRGQSGHRSEVAIPVAHLCEAKVREQAADFIQATLAAN